jgi:hypothetical protein
VNLGNIIQYPLVLMPVSPMPSPYFAAFQRSRVLVGLVLISLSSLGLGGCVPLSVKQQCDGVYKASRSFEDYNQEASRLMLKAIQKHVTIKPFDPNDPRPGEVKLAEVQRQLATVEQKTAAIHVDMVQVHRDFAKQLTQSAQMAKQVRAGDDAVKRWQEVLVAFYQLRGDYHSKVAAFQSQIKPSANRPALSPDQQKLLNEAEDLEKRVRDKIGDRYRDEHYEKFKRYCKIGPGVKIKSIGP